MSRTWIQQMPSYEINDLIRLGLDDFWPAVDGFNSTEVHNGDRVVVWQMGSGDDAGAVGLGTFSGRAEQLVHPVDYRDPNGPTRPRLSRQVRFTHWFPDEMVLRTDLRKDPAFADFLLFKTGGARGANVKAVTDAQWRSILSRTPVWAPVSSPTQVYGVELRVASDDVSDSGARREALRRLVGEDSSSLAVRVWPVQLSADPEDVIEVNATREGAAGVVWSYEVRGRTALDALGVALDLGGRTALPTASELRVERRGLSEQVGRG